MPGILFLLDYDTKGSLNTIFGLWAIVRLPTRWEDVGNKFDHKASLSEPLQNIQRSVSSTYYNHFIIVTAHYQLPKSVQFFPSYNLLRFVLFNVSNPPSHLRYDDSSCCSHRPLGPSKPYPRYSSTRQSRSDASKDDLDYRCGSKSHNNSCFYYHGRNLDL